jgi:hypothetical protein
VIEKETEKILKFTDLTVEIQCIWNVKIKVIPVMIGATGTISKSFRKYLGNMGKAQNQGTIENNHIGHSTHTHARFRKY